MMKRLALGLSLALAVALTLRLGSGFFKPRNPPVVASRAIEAHRTVPKEVKAILAIMRRLPLQPDALALV